MKFVPPLSPDPRPRPLPASFLLRALLLLPASLGLLCASCWAQADEELPYRAVFVDGSELRGKAVTDWHNSESEPKLDGKSLSAAEPALRLLEYREAARAKRDLEARGFVELVGGDRLPGRVVGYHSSSAAPWDTTPSHLLVRTDSVLDPPVAGATPIVRVLERDLRRVVWEPRTGSKLKPGTLFYRNGSQAAFRNFRWAEGAVHILLAEGPRRVSFAEIAELHLPRRDPWQAYYERLAVLSPEGMSRLVRIETTAGLIATASDIRFRATAHSSPTDSSGWYHMVQPAWSLDPLWVRFRQIRARLYFDPHEVPLSQIEPANDEQRSWLGRGWNWQADRNVRGGLLESGGRCFAWGIGVHATNRLWFDLPGGARTFQARLGLDRLAGGGGCVRASVYLNDASGKPLYQSDPLLGSQTVADTGTITLPASDGEPGRLVLEADAVGESPPPGADPLDIRDTFNWLEPLVVLDRELLLAEIQQQVPAALPGWQGWTVRESDSIPRVVVRWNEERQPQAGFATDVVIRGRSLVLATRRYLAKSDNWLLIELERLAGGERPGRIEVCVGERPIARTEISSIASIAPLLVSLVEHQESEVDLRVVYTPGDATEEIRWRTLSMVGRITRTDWEVLRPVSLASSEGATLDTQPDGSVLVTGKRPEGDLYTIIAQTDLPQITAFRLEALPDESLPSGGPGRADDGNFVLNRFRVGAVPKKQETVRGRYVRLELPGEQRILSLAEVQVFRGAENIARSGKPSQSSVDQNGPAELAIDGATTGDRAAGGRVTHTLLENDPWWEIDLGSEVDIERIVVWNRTDGGFHERLSDFRVAVLNAQRKEVWQENLAEPPNPNVELIRAPFGDIPLKSVAVDYAHGQFPASYLLTGPDAAKYGWSPHPQVGRPHVAVFTPEEPLDGREQLLIFTLQHFPAGSRPTLGRFRLSVCGDGPPIHAEPVGTELPLLELPAGQ